MGIPVLESKTSVTTNGTATNRDIDKPTGTAVGDWLILMGNVESVAGDFNDPTGFTEFFTQNAGSCIVNAWKRKVDGTEGATFNVSITSGTGENMVIACHRYSGGDPTDIVHLVGTPGGGANATSHVISEITTTAANCKIVALLGFDGGDGSPFGTSWTGGAEEDDLTQDAADGGRQSMSISLKDQASAGATGDCTVTSSANDGAAWVQFALLGADEAQTLTVPFLNDQTDTFHAITLTATYSITLPFFDEAGDTFFDAELARFFTDAIYPTAKARVLSGGIDLTGDIRAVLLDMNDYTYSAAHDFLDDIPAGARVAVSASFTGNAVSGGNFSADPAVFTSVTGDPVEGLVIYDHTGTDATSRLIAFMDTQGELIVPDGDSVQISWSGNVLEF